MDASYSPDGGSYSPDGGSYSPQFGHSSPRLGNYLADGGSYSADGGNYSPQFGHSSPHFGHSSRTHDYFLSSQQLPINASAQPFHVEQSQDPTTIYGIESREGRQSLWMATPFQAPIRSNASTYLHTSAMQIKEEQKKEEQKGEEVCYAEDDQTKEKSKKTEREGWAEKRRRYNEDVKRMKGHLTAKLNARQVTSSEAENEDNIFPINRKRMAAGEQTSNADLTVERGQGSRLGVRAIAQVTEDEEKPSASNPNVADDGLVYDLGTPTQDPFSPPTFENNSTTNMLSLIAKSTLEGLISQALEHLTITLTEDTNIRTAQGFQQSDSSSRASSSSSTTGTYPPNQSSPVHSTKRPLAPDRDPEDPDDDSDDDEPRRNKKGKGPVGREPHLGLRCPFYLRDPERYVKVQACSNGRGFANMARLRFHISRDHTQPLRCPRCWKSMKTQRECNAHLRERPGCDILPEPNDDRLPRDQWECIAGKRRALRPGENVEERWKALYKALFPDALKIPPPCDKSITLSQLELILPEVLEEELRKEFSFVVRPIIYRIKERMPLIIQNCKTRLENRRPPTSVLTPPTSSDHNLSTPETEGDAPNTSAEPTIFPDVSLSALSDIDIASWDHSDGLFCDPNASAEPNLGLDFSINALPSAPPFSEAHPQYDPKNWSGFDSTFVLPGEQTSFDDNPFTDHTQRQQDGSDLDSPWMASLDWAEPELAAGKEHVGHPSMSIASNTSSQSLEDTNVLGKQRLALEDPKS